MKDKDPNEDEFNQDEQDNINEADDSFGLPDLDFNTLDDEPEEDAAEPEDSSEPESSDSDDTPEEEPVVEEEAADEVVASEEPEAEAEELIEAEEEQESDYHESSEEDNITTEESDSNTGYVPPKPESNAPRIIAALVITVILSGAVWYFAFYGPQKAAEEKAAQALIDKKKADEAAAEKKRQEAARLAAEQKANEAADADEASSNEAVFSIISEPTGRYYIVIASFIDADMATDLGEKLKIDGTSSALLAPKGNKKFNRLTLGDYGSFNEAQEEANKLKGEHGDGLWVLKY